MEQPENKETSPLSEIPEHVKDYIKTQIDYYKLVAAESIGKAAAGAATGVVLALFGYLFLLFLSVTAAIGIGTAAGKLYLGFLIVAGFYLLLAVLAYLLKDKLITTPIINAIIKKMANSGKKDENSGNTTHQANH